MTTINTYQPVQKTYLSSNHRCAKVAKAVLMDDSKYNEFEKLSEQMCFVAPTSHKFTKDSPYWHEYRFEHLKKPLISVKVTSTDYNSPDILRKQRVDIVLNGKNVYSGDFSHKFIQLGFDSSQYVDYSLAFSNTYNTESLTFIDVIKCFLGALTTSHVIFLQPPACLKKKSGLNLGKRSERRLCTGPPDEPVLSKPRKRKRRKSTKSTKTRRVKR